MEVQIIAIIFSATMSCAATIISGIVLFSLRSMNGRITALESNQVALLQQRQRCQADFVDAEQWLRSEGYTRRQLDKLIDSYGRIETRLDLADRLPEISGQIAERIAHSILAAQEASHAS